jgi:hypothetical protein
MNNAVFWDVSHEVMRSGVSEEPSASISKVTRISELGTTLAVTTNRSTQILCIVFPRIVLGLLVTANVVSSSPILVTPVMGAIRSSETSVLTRVTLRKIPEDDILQVLKAVCSRFTPQSYRRRCDTRAHVSVVQFVLQRRCEVAVAAPFGAEPSAYLFCYGGVAQLLRCLDTPHFCLIYPEVVDRIVPPSDGGCVY